MTEVKSVFRISRGELRWPVGFALALGALLLLPYLFGWAIAPAGLHYSWLLSNTDDHNVYLSYMRQAHDGHLVFTDQFTTEPQQPWFFHSFFLTLGLLSKLSPLPLMVTYQLTRIICGGLLLVALYLLGARFLESLRARRFFLVFISLASGLGWLYVLLLNPTGNQPHPPDFGPGVVMPELITFLTLLLNPLFCFAVFLLVSTLLLYLIAVEQRSLKWALGAGITGLLLANIHSYDVIPLGLTIVFYLIGRAIIQRRFPTIELAYAAIIALAMLPPTLYQFHLYDALPVFRLKAEVATKSPSPIQFFLAMGLPLLFAIPGALLALKRAKTAPDYLLPVGWFVAIMLSIYLPFPFQRKMAEGLQIPVVLLATLFLSQALFENKKFPARQQVLVGALLVLACFPSNMMYLQKVLGDVQTLGSSFYAHLTPPLYLRAEQTQALAWLNGKVTRDQGVLCNPMLAAYVPAHTGGRCYAGHWAETINYPKKLGALLDFYSGKMPQPERENLLRKEGIQYLLVGPEEAALAQGSVPLTGLPVHEVQRIGEIVIYQVEG